MIIFCNFRNFPKSVMCLSLYILANGQAEERSSQSLQFFAELPPPPPPASAPSLTAPTRRPPPPPSSVRGRDSVHPIILWWLDTRGTGPTLQDRDNTTPCCITEQRPYSPKHRHSTPEHTPEHTLEHTPEHTLEHTPEHTLHSRSPALHYKT